MIPTLRASRCSRPSNTLCYFLKHSLVLASLFLQCLSWSCSSLVVCLWLFWSLCQSSLLMYSCSDWYTSGTWPWTLSSLYSLSSASVYPLTTLPISRTPIWPLSRLKKWLQQCRNVITRLLWPSVLWDLASFMEVFRRSWQFALSRWQNHTFSKWCSRLSSALSCSVWPMALFSFQSSCRWLDRLPTLRRNKRKDNVASHSTCKRKER